MTEVEKIFIEVIARLKMVTHVETDKDLAKLLGMHEKAFAQQKKRRKLPFEKIKILCLSLRSSVRSRSSPPATEASLQAMSKMGEWENWTIILSNSPTPTRLQRQ